VTKGDTKLNNNRIDYLVILYDLEVFRKMEPPHQERSASFSKAKQSRERSENMRQWREYDLSIG